MAIDPQIANISDRELNKFVESPTRPGKTATEVVGPVTDAALAQIDADLLAFKSANHADLLLLDSDLLAFKSQAHSDSLQLDTDVLAFKTQAHADSLQLDSDVVAFKNANHADILAVEAKQDTGNASLASIDGKVATEATQLAFKSANHTDFLAVEAKQDIGNASLASIDGKVATETTLSGLKTANHTDLLGVQSRQDTTNTEIGGLTETAPATDTASSGLNGRLQRIAQRLTTLIAFYTSDFGASSGAIRVAALPGNVTGIADFNSGSTGAQTPRSASNIYGVARATAPAAVADGSVVPLALSRNGQIRTQIGSEAMWGRKFDLCTGKLVLTGTTETPLLLIRNPNGSAFNGYLSKLVVGPTLGNNYVTYNFYVDATVSADGTPISFVGGRQSAQAAAVLLAFTGPTITANGALFQSVMASGLSGVSIPIPVDLARIIEPNHNILVTRTLSANATIGGVSTEHIEVPV